MAVARILHIRGMAGIQSSGKRPTNSPARRGSTSGLVALAASMFLAGCAGDETRIAQVAKTSLIGMSDLDLETCLGIPDHTLTRGKTTLFTYSEPAARTLNISVPIVNGIGMSFGGNCRATMRLENGRVVSVNYSGDSYGFEGPNSVCASIVRACLENRPT